MLNLETDVEPSTAVDDDGSPAKVVTSSPNTSIRRMTKLPSSAIYITGRSVIEGSIAMPLGLSNRAVVNAPSILPVDE